MSGATEVRERPILFSGEMVRAILDGRKTQTRRVATGINITLLESGATPEQIAAAARCPYGRPGDRLWVRETWAGYALVGAGDLWRIEYPADGDWRNLYPPEDWTPPRVLADPILPRRAPSIHMPRWASRITLEITDRRAERLQEISEEDAMAEGVSPDCPVGYIPAHQAAPHVYCFAQLWDRINGAGSWSSNPWVWALTFRRVEG